MNRDLVILALIAVIIWLLVRKREIQNEQRMRWTDYRGYNYDIAINRSVHS